MVLAVSIVFACSMFQVEKEEVVKTQTALSMPAAAAATAVTSAELESGDRFFSRQEKFVPSSFS